MNDKIVPAGIFGSGMVLQRERENRIWGSCPSDVQLTAALDGQSCPVERSGERFAVTLPACEASCGHTVELSCPEETVILEDVCFGDVFLLSGQSNMQLEVNRVMDVSGEEIMAADFPLVRQFTVEPRYLFGCQAQDIVPGPWLRAVFPQVMNMSAAGFFFGRRMHRELRVPIGLVLNAMGGSTIEAWMPEELLAQYGDFSAQIDQFRTPGALEERIRSDEQAAAAWHDALLRENEAVTASAIPSDAFEYSVPAMTLGTPLEGYSGSIWFYKEITLDSVPDKDGLLYIGDIVDSDRAYVNGQLVGETFYRYPPRKYPLPAGLLRQGRNLIAVRMVIDGTNGGFVPFHHYYLDTGDCRVDITGSWLACPESKAPCTAPPVLFPPVLPTGLYNASLCPLKGLEFTGVLWYQGESNVESPDRYNEKFNSMITHWRQLMSQRLPVVCVELCDYIDPTTGQTEVPEDWKAMQSMQRRQPEFTADCAVAPAADLGEQLELHPQRKQELGQRLAETMLSLAYEE